jgi:hypothetical protein
MAIDQNTNDMQKILAIVQNMQDQLSDFQESTEKRFDEIDQKFIAIDQRFDVIDQRFDAVDQKFIAIDQRFDAIDDQFDIVMQQFDSVRGEIKDSIEVAKEEMITRMDALSEQQRCDTNDVINQIRSLQDDKIQHHEKRITRLETLAI